MREILTPERFQAYLSFLDKRDPFSGFAASYSLLIAHDLALRAERDAALARARALRKELVGWLRIARIWAERWPESQATELIDKALAAAPVEELR